MKELEQHLFDIIEKLNNYTVSSREKQISKCQMSPLTECQERYLRLLDEYEPLTSGEFAKLICVSKPTVTQLINRFIDCGYVRKEACPNDRRAWYIRLTDEGKQVARIDQRVRIETIQYIQTNLNEEEFSQLIRLLDKLI